MILYVKQTEKYHSCNVLYISNISGKLAEK